MHDVDNYTLGKGVVQFNRKLASVYQGYRDLGNAPALSVSIALEMLDHFSSRSGMKSKDARVVQSATPKVSFTLDEVNPSNLELMSLGLSETVVQIATEGEALELTVVQLDRTYFDADDGHRKLKPPTYLKYDTGTVLFVANEIVYGATAYGRVEAVVGTSITGILVLSNVSGTFVNNEVLSGSVAGAAAADGTQVVVAALDVLVCNGIGTVIYTKTTDYTVDMDVGSITVLDAGSIVAGTIYMCYMAEKCTYTRIGFLDDSALEGELHFISDNPIGNNYELLFWRVNLMPTGDTAFIGEGWSSLQFEGEILKDETNHADDPYGFVIEAPTVVATTTT